MVRDPVKKSFIMSKNLLTLFYVHNPCDAAILRYLKPVGSVLLFNTYLL